MNRNKSTALRCRKNLFLFFFGLLSAFCSQANNIQITGINVAGGNVTFTLSWENSWNTMSNINPLYPNNWDGAWIFGRYQNNVDNLWKPIPFSAVSSDHSVTGASGVLQVDAVSDGMGVFVRRTNPGSGNISGATVTLKMGSLVGTGTFNFKIFGTEVVYVPQGDFAWGDGPGGYQPTTLDVNAGHESSGIGAGLLFASSPAVPAAYPVGHNAFYCMKYEISSEQWVDFLNTLTYDQQAQRVDAAPNSAANSTAYTIATSFSRIADLIRITTPGANNTTPAVFGCDFDRDNIHNEANDGLNIPIALISKVDLLAYLDWAGLRPMTEMEYEKACRGTQGRVAAEYSWGTATIVEYLRSGFTNTPGTATESLPGATAIVDDRAVSGSGPNGSQGPVRSGAFAQSTTGRRSSGATFWGIMDMTGNILELCVGLDANGTAYTGNHGNGVLTSLGASDVANWPSTASGTGIIARGGSWYETSNRFAYLSLSGRIYGYISNTRSVQYGGRGIRTAP
jgi:formylglycine-generating enzyme required for sulfatase activity